MKIILVFLFILTNLLAQENFDQELKELENYAQSFEIATLEETLIEKETNLESTSQALDAEANDSISTGQSGILRSQEGHTEDAAIEENLEEKIEMPKSSIRTRRIRSR